MAWYEAHQTLSKHPKTLKLSRLIKRDRRYAIGLLHDLFSWGLDSAKKDGTLPGMNSDDIASALDFSGKTGKQIVEALVESGYLELENGTFRIHDWYDYAGKLADRREADKNRKRGTETERKVNRNDGEFRRNSDGNPTEIQGAERGNPYATVPYPTVPYQNNNIHTNAHARVREDEQDDGFTEFWTAYPRKSGDIRQAYMAYLHALGQGATQEKLIEAIKAQTDGATPEDLHFLPSAEKWLRNQGWESKASIKSERKEETAPRKKKQYTTAAEYTAQGDPTSGKSVDEIWADLDKI